jgi:hypothetical protein
MHGRRDGCSKSQYVLAVSGRPARRSLALAGRASAAASDTVLRAPLLTACCLKSDPTGIRDQAARKGRRQRGNPRSSSRETGQARPGSRREGGREDGGNGGDGGDGGGAKVVCPPRRRWPWPRPEPTVGTATTGNLLCAEPATTTTTHARSEYQARATPCSKPWRLCAG